MPDDVAVAGQAEIGIGSGSERLGAAEKLAADGLERCRLQGLAGCGVAFWKEAETEEAADELAST